MLSNTGKHTHTHKKKKKNLHKVIHCLYWTNRTSSRGTQLTWFEVDLTWFWNLRDFDFVLKLKDGIKWENVLALLSIKKTKVSMSSSSNDISFACKSKVHETKDLTIHLVKFLWTFFYSFIYLWCPWFLKILYLSINKIIIIIIIYRGGNRVFSL